MDNRQRAQLEIFGGGLLFAAALVFFFISGQMDALLPGMYVVCEAPAWFCLALGLGLLVHGGLVD